MVAVPYSDIRRRCSTIGSLPPIQEAGAIHERGERGVVGRLLAGVGVSEPPSVCDHVGLGRVVDGIAEQGLVAFGGGVGWDGLARLHALGVGEPDRREQVGLGHHDVPPAEQEPDRPAMRRSHPQRTGVAGGEPPATRSTRGGRGPDRRWCW